MTFSTVLIDRELAAVREFDGGECADFSPGQLHDVSDALGRARRSLDALVVMVAGEVGRRSAPELGVGGLSRREGFSTPQEMLAKSLGTSTYDAKRLIDVGNSLSAGDDSQRDTDAPGQANGDGNLPGLGSSRAPKYPVLAQAVEAGALGVEAAALVTRTMDTIVPVMIADAEADARVATAGIAAAGPGDQDALLQARTNVRAEVQGLEQRLVEKAQAISVRELRQVCERERAWRAPRDLVERERRQRDSRKLFFGEDSDGMTVLTAKMDAISAAPVKAWIEAQVRHAFQQRRPDKDSDGHDVVASQVPGFGTLSAEDQQRLRDYFLSDERTPGQIRLDSLVSMFHHCLDCDTPTSGVKTTVVIHADVKNLEDDLALGECDQLSGPISMGTLRAMAVDAAVIPAVMGGKSMPLDIGRLDRYFTKYQRIALNERDGGCSWCHAPPSFCQAHHIDWWVKHHGRTDISNGVLLCVSCHHRIHRDGWEISVKNDQVWFQPPDMDGRSRPARVGGRAHLALSVE